VINNLLEERSKNLCDHWCGDGSSSPIGLWFLKPVYQEALAFEFSDRNISSFENSSYLESTRVNPFRQSTPQILFVSIQW